ncbi:MAG: hypothetical protein R2752_18060 [Vicinamibacterales bacterium]
MSSAMIFFVAQTLRDVPAHDPVAPGPTMAVLPTPGSPMSTGLFFVRRAST